MRKEISIQHQISQIKGIFHALRLIFNEGEYADKAIETVMHSNKSWKARDRGFIVETTYDMIRYWRLLVTLTNAEGEMDDRKLWSVFGAWMIFRGYHLPPHPHFNQLHPGKLLDKLEKFSKIRKIRESVPDWLDKLGEKELKTGWDKVLEALNQRPSIVVRTNTLKTSPGELQQLFSEEGLETVLIPWAPEAVQLKYPRNVFRTEAFQQGLFEVQDAASQAVAAFLDVKPGLRVVDACAGSGGKTLHLCSLMNNKGRVIALDVSETKLNELKKRSKRSGAGIIEIRTITSTKIIKRLYGSADRLLLDVPCSGLGVLRRNPDAKWKLDEQELENLKKMQRDILEKYSPVTKVGGMMVYATCSILPSEGEAQINYFLEKHGETWEMLEEKRLSPVTEDCDGFYMALLKRKK